MNFDQSINSSKHQPLRVVLDECVGADSRLVREFQKTLGAGQQVQFLSLSKAHRAMPDSEILSRLLGPGTVLLTTDCVLHNQACDLGFRSYTLNAQGGLIRKKLAQVKAPVPIPARGFQELREDYTHGNNPIASALKTGLAERDFKRYSTRRRRIRSYFGCEANISQVSLTIGARTARIGFISGYFLALAGFSGVKGIRASEGYGRALGREPDPAQCLIHALRELYLLQLERIPIELYVIPADSLSLVRRLQLQPATPNEAPSTIALSKLLHGLSSARSFPCVKGPFFEAMEHKLNQMATGASNELTPVDCGQLIGLLAYSTEHGIKPQRRDEAQRSAMGAAGQSEK